MTAKKATKKTPAIAPRPAIVPRPKAMHCLVDKKGQSITIYDAISVAQLFAQPPEGIDAEVARSVYVYPYGQKGALFRYRVDAALLEKKPAKHKPVATTDAMNEHLTNEDSYRPCHTLSSDGRELYFLRYGKAMKRAELMTLDPITLEALRPPVTIATRGQFGYDRNPLLPAGPGRVLVRAELEKRKGGMHWIDVKTGAALASIEDAPHASAWHPAGAASPYIALGDDGGVRVLSLEDGSLSEIAKIDTEGAVMMLDAGPSSDDAAFTVHALIDREEVLAVKRYLVRPSEKPAKRVEFVGDFLAEDITFATHLPQSIRAMFDGRLLAVVGSNVATAGLWEWFAPGRALEEHIVETEIGEDGRVFRLLSNNGAALCETGQIVPAPIRERE